MCNIYLSQELVIGTKNLWPMRPPTKKEQTAKSSIGPVLLLVIFPCLKENIARIAKAVQDHSLTVMIDNVVICQENS